MLRLLTLLLLSLPLPSLAATAPSSALLASWVAMDAPTGHEHHGTDALASELDGWRVDRMGNLIKTVGSGETAQVVACLLDAPAFTVSEIREDGYLRLHDIGRPPVHALWAQAHEGQQLRILTDDGPVIGVSALANGHFMNLHRDEKTLTRTDDLWVDVGAESAGQVAAMGIELLDPVLRHLPAWHFEGWIAGPAAGARIGCATVVAAAEAGLAGKNRVHYVLSTQSAFGAVGLSAAVSSLEDVGSVLLLGPGTERGKERGSEHDADAEDPDRLFRRGFAAFDTRRLTMVSPTVHAAGTLMERVRTDEAERLAGAVVDALAIDPQELAWTPAPPQAFPVNDAAPWLASRPDREDFSDRLVQLGERYAVSGYETPVRIALMEAMPAWARERVQTDPLGNLWVEAGPADAEATVFMAHMDEVGWVVTAIHADGTVDLERRGGALALAREGQPALLHVSPESGDGAALCPPMLRGVFLSRAEPETRWPETLQAWFGLNALGLEAAGVSVGMPVTGYKEAHRLGPHRFTVRGMDDRVGSAALLAAVQRLDPSTLDYRVIFAWSVQEENGLHGARALAERFAASTRRVYSIDTFVSSDTPLESTHFAHAPLGRGPVLRSMESSGLVTDAELARNRAIAAAAGTPVQVGMTQGGTDGTAFTYFGAPNAGLSWPGRYSHGPAELGDLRDMEGLVELIGAFVRADPAASAFAAPVTVGGNGRNCALDAQCINRLHPAIPMTAEARPGQTLVMHTRNASDFDLDPGSTYEDPRREGGIETAAQIAGIATTRGAREATRAMRSPDRSASKARVPATRWPSRFSRSNPGNGARPGSVAAAFSPISIPAASPPPGNSGPTSRRPKTYLACASRMPGFPA